MPFEDFDKKIKEAADQHHPAYDEKAWRKMEKLLDEHLPQQKDDRRRILFFLLVILLLGGGLYVAISKPWNKKPTSSELAQKNQTKVPQPSSNPAPDQDGKSISPSESDQLNKKNDNKIAGQQTAEEKTDVGLSVVDLSSGKQSRRSVTYDNSSEKNTVIKSGSLLNKVDGQGNENIPGEKTRKNVQEAVSNNPTDQTTAKLNSGETNNDETKTTNTSIIKNDAVGSAGNDIKSNQDSASETTEKKTAQSKKAVKNKNGFNFSVSAGPDVSKAGGSKTGKTTLVYGAGVGYTFDRFTVKTGVYLSKKIYWAGPNDYKLSYTPPSTKFEGANANCQVIEIPLKVNYAFDVTNKSNWFAGVGLSSYLMKSEKYDYKYESASSTYYHSYQTKYENKHYFSILDLSAGYSHQINHTLSISAEPYIEIPLTGIGVGKVHLNSGGILFTLNVKPFSK